MRGPDDYRNDEAIELSYLQDFALHRESCGLGDADEPDHSYYADALVCKPDAEARRWEEE